MTLFTGKSIREECVDPSYNLIGRILSRRVKWLGKIFRASDSYIVKQAVIEWAENAGEYEAGSIMEGAPEHSNIHEVIEMAQDFDRWNVIVMSLRSRY